MIVDSLARLHLVDPEPLGLGTLGKPEGFIERQIGGWLQRCHPNYEYRPGQLQMAQAVEAAFRERLARIACALVRQPLELLELCGGHECSIAQAFLCIRPNLTESSIKRKVRLDT